jgi:conjugative transfer region protein TrbK
MFVAAAALAPALAVAACAIQLRDGTDGSPRSPVSRKTSPDGAELERCRKVTLEQAVELQDCRQIWAENRRRFLASKKTPAASSVDAQPSSSTPLARLKHPERLPSGWPPVAASERE